MTYIVNVPDGAFIANTKKMALTLASAEASRLKEQGFNVLGSQKDEFWFGVRGKQEAVIEIVEGD